MIIKITKLTFCIKGATKSPQREEGYSLGTIDFVLFLCGILIVQKLRLIKTYVDIQRLVSQYLLVSLLPPIPQT